MSEITSSSPTSTTVTVSKSSGKCDEQQQLKESIIKARNAIKKKFSEPHNLKMAISERVNEVYKPIIEPLKTPVDDTKKRQQQQPHEPKNIKHEKLMSGAPGTSASIFNAALPPLRKALLGTAPPISNSMRHTSSKHNLSGVSQLQWADHAVVA